MLAALVLQRFETVVLTGSDPTPRENPVSRPLFRSADRSLAVLPRSRRRLHIAGNRPPGGQHWGHDDDPR
jgi:hypothetical protein